MTTIEEFALCFIGLFALFILILFIRAFFRMIRAIKNRDRQVMNDYEKSEHFKARRAEFQKRIKETKERKGKQ